jgi:hypothetical protein
MNKRRAHLHDSWTEIQCPEAHRSRCAPSLSIHRSFSSNGQQRKQPKTAASQPSSHTRAESSEREQGESRPSGALPLPLRPPPRAGTPTGASTQTRWASSTVSSAWPRRASTAGTLTVYSMAAATGLSAPF